MSEIIFIGAGGHAKVIRDILLSNGLKPRYYLDEKVEAFFDLKKISDDELIHVYQELPCVLSLGGVTPEKLSVRANLYRHYKTSHLHFPVFKYKASIISDNCEIGEGTTIGMGAIVNSSVIIEECVIVNTGAIIEHDVHIDAGAHICPGAILLGGCKVGKNSLIGSGAIILPGAMVPDNYLVPANTRYPTRHE